MFTLSNEKNGKHCHARAFFEPNHVLFCSKSYINPGSLIINRVQNLDQKWLNSYFKIEKYENVIHLFQLTFIN